MRDHCKDHFLLNIDPGQWLSLNGRAVASDLRDVHVKSCHCQILIAFNRFEKSKKLKKKRLGVVHFKRKKGECRKERMSVLKIG